ncbi:MAG: iron ABC transporter permease [Dysgonamonadaceae bacterium]|jgi:iron complex transport system permease protein|nr:iron ABC transporter permease [Dysgonamonadaceae bacterium]
MKNKKWVCVLLLLLIVLLFYANLIIGSVNIPADRVMAVLTGKSIERSAWIDIILYSRVPQAVTAMLSGAALAVSGLMLQILFQNPLAGPSILGITNGATLGAALVMMCFGGTLDQYAWWLPGGSLSVVVAAFVGALAVLSVIVYFSTKVKNNVLVLIIGMMVGYLVSSIIAILNSVANAENIQLFVVWGLGSFSGVSVKQLPFFSITVTLGLMLSLLLIKPLNILSLGERYASNLGIHINRTRVLILLCTGLLTAIVTAYCGPIGFIGLAVPHLARLVLKTADQQFLLPAVILSGAVVALLCNLLTAIPFRNGLLPLNAVTPMLGVPVIIYVIVNRKNLAQFN